MRMFRTMWLEARLGTWKKDGMIVSSLRLGCDQLLFKKSCFHFPSFFWGHVLEMYTDIMNTLCELPRKKSLDY